MIKKYLLNQNLVIFKELINNFLAFYQYGVLITHILYFTSKQRIRIKHKKIEILYKK